MKVTSLLLTLFFFVATSCHSTKNVTTESGDGSSFEQAVIVNSISEEYDYVRKVCNDCEFVSQYLLFKKKKPYDMLEFKKSNGEKVEYYFDISKFF
jgi:hypothetical protein